MFVRMVGMAIGNAAGHTPPGANDTCAVLGEERVLPSQQYGHISRSWMPPLAQAAGGSFPPSWLESEQPQVMWASTWAAVVAALLPKTIWKPAGKAVSVTSSAKRFS